MVPGDGVVCRRCCVDNTISLSVCNNCAKDSIGNPADDDEEEKEATS